MTFHCTGIHSKKQPISHCSGM